MIKKSATQNVLPWILSRFGINEDSRGIDRTTNLWFHINKVADITIYYYSLATSTQTQKGCYIVRWSSMSFSDLAAGGGQGEEKYRYI